jgi:peptide/nickel transport system permease protein
MTQDARPSREEIGDRSTRDVAEQQDAFEGGTTASVKEVGPALLAEQTGVVKARGPWRLAWERLRRDRVALLSAGVIVFIALFAICAPLVTLLTGHGENDQYNQVGLTAAGLPKPPSANFIFGTDSLGRDILVRTAYGARISLLVGVVATGISIVIGTILGLAAGYLGKVVDSIVARIIDVVLAFPFLLFAISLVAITGPSLTVSVIAIGVFSWGAVARIVRGQVLSIREKEYVEAARSLGASDTRIMFVDIFPNVLAPVIVYTTLLIPVVIVAMATLAFLGLGLPVPQAAWGVMISDAIQSYREAPWDLIPGAFLLAATLAFNLFGDGVRDAFDPRGDRLFGAA